MLKVTAIEEKMGVGSTLPFRVTCSDSKQYIMKGINASVPTGKALFNENFAAHCAGLVKLHTPFSTIGELSKELIDKTELKKYDFESGPCFLSTYLEGTSLRINRVVAKHISNIEIIPDLILFDTILMNSDRDGNEGNWFFTKEDNKLVVIDHTNIFRVAQIWDVNTLTQDKTIPPLVLDEIKYGDNYHTLVQAYKYKYPRVHHPFSPMKRRINSLSIEKLKTCIDNIPIQWGISEDEKDAALDFVCFQIDHIDDIIQELEKDFKF